MNFTEKFLELTLLYFCYLFLISDEEELDLLDEEKDGVDDL